MGSDVLIATAAIVVPVLVLSVIIYNRLVALRNEVERAWANIDVILKQRFDEIPQLVQVVEQVAQYEGHLLQQLNTARQHYGSAASRDQKIKASGEISVALQGVMGLAEAYPDLKASENFRKLQQRISDLENALSDRREIYNEAATIYNTRIEQVPDLMVAILMGAVRQQLYQVTAQEKTLPSLKMNIPGTRT